MSFLNQEWIKESPCPSNEKFDSPSGTGHVSGSYTYTCVSVSPNICDTRCKGSDKVEFYCGSASGCGWETALCWGASTSGCNPNTGKCYCKSDDECRQYYNINTYGYWYRPYCLPANKIPSNLQYSSCDSSASCSNTQKCLTTESMCGCSNVADCCSQATQVDAVRGKAMKCEWNGACTLGSGTDICCKYDSDCPAKDNVKGKCDSPSGTDNPDTPGYTYTCYWKPCSKNDECVDNSCCDKDPAIPAADQGSGTCNWGPSSSSRIYKNKYLCDPPEWSSDVKTTSNKDILEVIFAFFSHFFQR